MAEAQAAPGQADDAARPKRRKRLFSGIQPTGGIHIGNYLGAIRNWVELASTYDAIYCVVDYHAITIEYDRQAMPDRVLDTATIVMACGITPDSGAKLFIQSRVPEHTELAWILSSVTPMGELSRMTQFKDKSKQHAANINVGLFSYPVLQAADILLYKAEAVPVGEDQVQHLELSREIVRAFKRRFAGRVFPEPKPVLSAAGRVKGLDGDAKMSKSKGNTIELIETRKQIQKKIRPAKTDERRVRREDRGEPAVCNIFALHGYFTDEGKRAEIAHGCRTAAIGCVDCKDALVDAMDAELAPIRARYEELKAKPEVVRAFLDESAAECRAIAQATMREVRERMGLRRKGEND